MCDNQATPREAEQHESAHCPPSEALYFSLVVHFYFIHQKQLELLTYSVLIVYI